MQVVEAGLRMVMVEVLRVLVVAVAAVMEV
jgi:hypothetical protein